MMDLDGSAALVTGGAHGIGAAVAGMLADRGAGVMIADVDGPGAEELAAQLGVRSVECDVSSLASVQSAVERAVSAFGALDTLVLNAGIGSGFTLEAFDESAYRRAMGVNLDGVVFGLVAGVPALRAAGGGRIVVVASLAGLAPVPADPVYAANKAAVVNLVRSVAPGLASQGIVVNAVCPGYTDTAILDGWRQMLAAMDWPVMSTDDVVRAVGEVLALPESGQAWFVQYGRPAAPYRFAGLPGPLRG